MRQRAASILFNAACGLSMLVCVLALAGLMVQHLRSDSWTWQRFEPAAAQDWAIQKFVDVRVGGGVLSLVRGRLPVLESDIRSVRGIEMFHLIGGGGSLRHYLPSGAGPGTTIRQTHPAPGFTLYQMDSTRNGIPVRVQAVQMPLAALAAVAAILPLLWEIRHRRRAAHFNRSRRGFCRSCGYDLRESANRCPECGSIPQRRWSRLDRLLHAPLTRLRG